MRNTIATAIILILILKSIVGSAITYYSKATGNANTLATWGVNADGSGAAPTNFTTAGDIFNLRAGSALNTNANWNIGNGVTLNIIGSLDISTLNDHVIINGTLNLDGWLTVSGKNADITINGTVKFTNATTTQVTLTGGGGGSGTDFILTAGASLITNNINGVSGTNCSLPATAPKMAVTLSTAANYTFNGTSAQSTTGLPGTVNNLTINNASATGVSLVANVTVNGVLTLTDGLLIGFTVTVTTAATTSVTAYSSNSYVTGTLSRAMNASGTYDFPVGTLAYYEPATITNNAVVGPSSVAVYFSPVNPGTPVGVTFDGTIINGFLNYGRWVMTPNVAITGGNFNLTLTSRGHTNAAPFLDYHGILRSTGLASPNWIQPGTNILPAHTALMPTDPVTVSMTGITSYPTNNFAIGFSNTYVLPITLSEFQVIQNSNSNLLEWTTENEINSDYFLIERSADAFEFNSVGQVQAAGHSSVVLHYSFTDDAPMQGANYYRLKIVDLDGSFTYSKIVIASTSKPISVVNIYPNPAREVITVSYDSSDKISGIQIFNISGQLVSAISNISSTDIMDMKFDIRNFDAGMYYLIANLENGKQIQSVFVKQ